MLPVEKQSTGAETDVERATQPVQVPGAVLATRPVEAPGAAPVTYTTGQEADLPAVVYRPEVQPPGPAAQPSTTAKQSSTYHPGSVAPAEEPAAEYPSRTSETAGLARDQFVKSPKRLKWYGIHCEKKDFSRSKVHTWTNEPARMNSTFPRITNRSLPSAPASRPVSQENLRKWERAACDQSYMCNQAAAFSRCLTKVQGNMASQLKIIQSVTCKGKSATKVSQAADKLDFLVTFNRSITQAMARTMQDLSEGVFVNVANLTLARRNSYLEYIKAGIKQDTLTSLRTAPLHLLSALFPDHIIAKAEEAIRHHENKRTSGPSQRKLQRFHPYSQPPGQQQEPDQKQGRPAWKQLGNRRCGQRSHRGKATSSFSQ